MPDRAISDAMPEPTVCNNCGSNQIAFINNAFIYGKPVGDWPYLWFCYECKASVHSHRGTRSPLGTMAGTEIKTLRIAAHRAFDCLWLTDRILDRNDAYLWLADKLGLEVSKCHIGMLTKQQLKLVETLSIEFVRTSKAQQRKNQIKDNKIKRQQETLSRRLRTEKRDHRNGNEYKRRKFSLYFVQDPED